MVSVNRPTDPKLKEQDINRKLQVYGITEAFSNGKVPSNEQIDVALNSFLRQKFMTSPSQKLSVEGQGLVKDFRSVVEQAKVLLLTNNQGNLLQDFIWQCQNIDGGNAALPQAQVSKETAKQHGDKALDGLKTIGTLIVSNGQFRKLLSDATVLLRDMAGDAAQKVAEKVNPDEEDLKQIDKPAPDNQFHDVPDLSMGNLKAQAKQAIDKNTPINTEDVKAAAKSANKAADPHGSSDPQETAKKAANDGQSSGVDPKGGLQAGINTLKDRADGDQTEEAKQKKNQVKDMANAKKDQAKNYMSEKMPEERREQVTYRLKKMLVEIQGHPDYMSAINTLLDLAEEYSGHAAAMASETAGSVQGAHTDTNLERAEKDLKTLIERFANYTSTDDLMDSIKEVYRDADRDPELKKWFKGMDAYIRKALKKQGYVLEDQATEEYNKLYDQGEFLLRDRYRNHTDRIADEFKFLADQFDADPVNKRFADSVQKLFTDLGNDENGKPTFKPHLVKDLTEVILPAALQAIQYVPIPRIEYSDPMFDAVIENLVIESDNLTPNLLEFASDNYWRWGRKNIANRNKNAIMISVSGIQLDLKDVAYYVRKKEGFPSVKDTGLMDIFLGGSGLSFKMKVETADKHDQQAFFKVNKVDIDVKNFDIKLKKSSKKLLFNIFKPLMLKVMRPAIQKVLEKVIKDKFNEADRYLYDVKKEADRALEQAKNDPEQAQNIYERYFDAFKAKMERGKKKTEEATADKTANLAMTQHDSIFPNIKLPGGISTAATKYKEMAAQGSKWESPIFSLGSAGPTKDLPKVREIQRKHHSVTQGGVRGPQNIGNTKSMTQTVKKDEHVAKTGGNPNGSATTGYSQVDGTNGSAGFSSQVDKAFSNGPSSMGTSSNLGSTTGAMGTSSTLGNTTGGTMFGANNPVFSGKAAEAM